MRPDYTTSPFGCALTPDEIVRQVSHLPSAPRVLPRLKKLLSDTNSSIHDVVAMIRLDPGIAARVLQIGNSAYYSQGMRCYTVDEAVNRVGYDQVYELVAVAVASQVLVRPLAAYGLESDELWRMSVTCAMAAENIARRLALEGDIAYTAGLLHGVGLVAIDEWAFRMHPELRFPRGPLPLETYPAEREMLGFHNAEVGAALLRLWEFPAIMSEPVRWQYMPRGTMAHTQNATVLHLAKWIRTTVCTNSTTVPKPEASLLRSVKLTQEDLDKLVEEVRVQMDSVSSLLETDPSNRATIPFPSADRTIVDQGPSRGFINRYA